MSECEQLTIKLIRVESPCDHQLERPRVDVLRFLLDDDDLDGAHICRGID